MKGKFTKFKKQYRLQLIMIPMTIWAILIFYIPILGNIIAFQDYSIGKGIFHSPWVGPVSYTHLDVYKRQGLWCCGLYGDHYRNQQ